MKKCLYCAKEIQEEALVCKYCESDLSGMQSYSSDNAHDKISGLVRTKQQGTAQLKPWKVALPIGIVVSVLVWYVSILPNEILDANVVIWVIIYNPIVYTLIFIPLVNFFYWATGKFINVLILCKIRLLGWRE